MPDEAILEAQRDLSHQGLWVEPASAAGIAGLRSEVKAGNLHLAGKRVVVVCTGHGLKDPRSGGRAAKVIEPTMEALEELLKL